jgi:hypothetical protein
MDPYLHHGIPTLYLSKLIQKTKQCSHGVTIDHNFKKNSVALTNYINDVTKCFCELEIIDRANEVDT